MNSTWFFNILMAVVLVVFFLFIKFNQELGKWGRGFWTTLFLIDIYLYLRTMFAQNYPSSGSWDDLVYGLFFAFVSYALLSSMISTWLYILYKRKQSG